MTRFAGALLVRPALILISAITVALIVASLVAIVLYEMRQDAFARARDTVENLALILERDIERNIEIYELSMQAVTDGAKDPTVLQLPPRIRQRVLFDRSSNAQDLGSLFVTNAAGDVVFDSRAAPARKVNLSDLEYFRVQQGGDAGLFFSKPFLPRIDRPEPSIGLSQRLEDARGRFAGVVVGTLRLNYFRRLFDGVTVGAHGSITLVRTDGTVLMRRPYHEKEIGSSIAGVPSFKPLLQADKGCYIGKAALDGARRLYGFQHVGKYPLIVVVGLGAEDIYAEWQRRAWVIGIVVGVLDALGLLMAVAFAKQFRMRLEMQGQLQTLADTDSLTGLDSRRVLDTALDVEWRRARRHKQSLAVLMVDADNFKDFNDHYGHVAGDSALKTIAQCIFENIRRPGDIAGRYGGEEFCVLLPDTELAGAIHVAETIRLAVFAANQPHVGSSNGKLSVSIGVATFDGDAAFGVTAELLVHRADQRLYEAKAAGRNTVMPQKVRPQWAAPQGSSSRQAAGPMSPASLQVDGHAIDCPGETIVSRIVADR
ncbi:putative signal transduction ggdef domain transmembrane protein [Pandoraea terrae]|uniref:diguanylate cyclase n=2 Tax=Pandoraea terrae TaxID=1537710 RepID=A0A5E4S2V9_9BURK|nr:putative signal transduction ggdef domain transmembrane protein [Pandoraea terrae]